MDPVEQINNRIRDRIGRLGDHIIRFDEEKKQIVERNDLSEPDRTELIKKAQSSIEDEIDAAFGDREDSIIVDISFVAGSVEDQPLDAERALMAIEIWQNELPGLREFLEYCAEMIDAHPGKPTPEIRKSQKCITEAEVVMAKISARVKTETGG